MAVYEGNEKYIFISYSHADTEQVLPIIEALQESGFRVWYDSGIETGTEWPEYIAERLISARCMLAIMSPNASESRNCRNEINMALSRDKDILVAHLVETKMSIGLELNLNSSQAFFCYRHKSFDSMISALMKSKLLKECREIPLKQSPCPTHTFDASKVATEPEVSAESELPPGTEDTLKDITAPDSDKSLSVTFSPITLKNWKKLTPSLNSMFANNSQYNSKTHTYLSRLAARTVLKPFDMGSIINSIVSDTGSPDIYTIVEKVTGRPVFIFLPDRCYINIKLPGGNIHHSISVPYTAIHNIKGYSDRVEIALDNIFAYGQFRSPLVKATTLTIPKTPEITDVCDRFRSIILEILLVYNGEAFTKENRVKRIIESYIKKIPHSNYKFYLKSQPDEKYSKREAVALKKYAFHVKPEEVIAFVDTTLFGNGRDGILFSTGGISFDYAFEKIYARYDEIEKLYLTDDKKHLKIRGNFSARKNPSNSAVPHISDIMIYLEPLKECLEEVINNL